MPPTRKKPTKLYVSPNKLIQKTIDIRGKLYNKRKAILVSSPMKKRKEPYQYKTTQNFHQKKAQKFLKTFQAMETRKRKKSFSVEIRHQATCAIEAKNSLVLMDTSKPKKSILARIGLGFEKNAIILEVIQGRKKGELERNMFKSLKKANWPNHMIEQIEQHARINNYEEIKIRRPETLHAYHLQNPEIKEQMRTLYYSIAKAMGYEKKWPYFVKKIK